MTIQLIEIRPCKSDTPPLKVEEIKHEIQSLGWILLSAIATEQGWWIRAKVHGKASIEDLSLPTGWSAKSNFTEQEYHDWNDAPDRAIARRLGDPYAFALLQWPAVIAVLDLAGSGWQRWLKIALLVWLLLIMLASYAGRRPGRIVFGNAMLLSSLALAAFWWAHPGGWMYAWLFLMLILFYCAQRALVSPDSRFVGVHGKGRGL